MPSVVFTGKGMDPLTSKLRTRSEWETLAHAKGFYAQNKVNVLTDYLVASRRDTSKARDALAYGVKVITYDEFEAMLRGKMEVTAHNSGGSVPVFTPIDTTGMEEIDGWGMF